MIFNSHSNLVGQHALLSASKYHWIRYTDEHFIEFYNSYTASERGTQLHEFAAQAIKLGVKLPKNNNTLNAYVNDAIGYRMKPEQVLYYSENCFGTADTISFRKERGHDKELLRIHDLKTGVTPAHIDQLEVYAAIFCLEYGYKPNDIDIELRIYQVNDVNIVVPEADIILPIMDKIKHFDSIVKDLRKDD